MRNEDMHLKSDPEKELTAFDENRAETEKELWRRCSEGDDEAREELILAYRPMVYWLAKKLRVPYSTYPDLIQEGMLSLINAVDRFDVERNNVFPPLHTTRSKRMINFIQRVESRLRSQRRRNSIYARVLQSGSVSEHADRAEWTLDLEEAMNSLSKGAEIVKALVIEGRMARRSQKGRS